MTAEPAALRTRKAAILMTMLRIEILRGNSGIEIID
jgi:hypothetical protein